MLRAFTTGPFTGRHAAILTVLFFAVVIAVNVIMVRAALQTFGGTVVENAYVAGQSFNGWLREAKREQALGWSAAVQRRSDGRVVIRLGGVPAGPVRLSGEARHPLGALSDRTVAFVRQADGSFLAAAPLPAGRWQLRLAVAAGGQLWRTQQDL